MFLVFLADRLRIMARGKLVLLVVVVLAVAYAAEAEAEANRRLLKRRGFFGKKGFAVAAAGNKAEGTKGKKRYGNANAYASASHKKKGAEAYADGVATAVGKGTTSKTGSIGASKPGKASVAAAGTKVETKKGTAKGGAVAVALGKRGEAVASSHSSVDKKGKATASSYSRASVGSKSTKG